MSQPLKYNNTGTSATLSVIRERASKVSLAFSKLYYASVVNDSGDRTISFYKRWLRVSFLVKTTLYPISARCQSASVCMKIQAYFLNQSYSAYCRRCFRLDPHADTGVLTLSADWVKCCFY